MLKQLLKNKEFLKIIRVFLEKPEIVDIILFGSSIRGKDTPEDIDLLVVYSREEIIDINYELRKKLEGINKNIEIIGKRYEDIFKPEFVAREAILSEGFSFRQKNFISRGFGYDNFILFRYSLKGFNKSRRMQFYYSLYGRGNMEGLLKKSNSNKFSDSIILCPIENSELIKDFFEKLKIKFVQSPILIPNRTIKYLVKRD